MHSTVPEIIDPVFAKTSQNARFLLSEYERFGLVFTKTRVYEFRHWMASFFSVKNVIIFHGLNAIMFEVLDVIICECIGSGANSFKWYHFPGTYFVSIYVIIWWLSFFTVSRCYPF